MPTETDLARQYDTVCQEIAAACGACGRSAGEVLLLAVSKTHSVEKVLTVYQAGARDFGENYVQEGVEKIQAFEQLMPKSGAVWHFIGPLQSNKTQLVAMYFDWVHSVDRLKIAQRLSAQRPITQPTHPLNVCLQVNIDDETGKSGCTVADAIELAQAIAALPRLRLRGLMAIPAPVDKTLPENIQRAPFEALAALFKHIKEFLPNESAQYFDTLSMGMSDDYPHAIAAGSTMVRIGTAIFGAREYPPSI